MTFWQENYAFIKDVYDMRHQKMAEWMENVEKVILFSHWACIAVFPCRKKRKILTADRKILNRKILKSVSRKAKFEHELKEIGCSCRRSEFPKTISVTWEQFLRSSKWNILSSLTYPCRPSLASWPTRSTPRPSSSARGTTSMWVLLPSKLANLFEGSAWDGHPDNTAVVHLWNLQH